MTVALFEQPHVRPYQVKGDCMEPTLRVDDFLMIRPAMTYEGEGTYVLDFAGDGVGSPFMAEKVPVCGRDEIKIWHPNPAYSRHVISVDDFNRAVCAKVVAEVHLKERLPEIARRLAA